VMVGGSAVGVGTSPNGMIPSGLRPVWGSVVRRRALLVGIIVVVVGLWALRIGGVIDNWTLAWCLIAVAVLGSSVPYAIDRRRGDAPAAFGMPAVVPVARHNAASPAPLALDDLSTVPGPASTTAGTGSHGT